jgi:uncharacterized protein YndB with AHSA1/START domain
MKVEHVVEIDRPRDEVWAVFDDPDLMVEWQGNLLSYEQAEGASDEIGSVSLQTVKNVGVKQELTVTLLERTAPELSSSRYEGAQVPFTVVNTFSELDDGSTEWHAELEVRLGLVQKALAPILKPIMSELVQRNGRDFKKFVESR